MAADDSVPEVVILANIPKDGWYEGSTTRPNGHILATRVLEPELHDFDPDQPDEPPRLVHTFPDANTAMYISPLKGCQDEYVVYTADVEWDSLEISNYIVWRVAFKGDNDEPPIVTRIAILPDAGCCMGCVSVTERTLLISDAYKDNIWLLDISTGRISVFLADDTMRKTGDGKTGRFGICAIRINGDYLWFANASAGTLCRIPIALEDDGAGWDVRPTGPVEIVADDVPNTNGLVLTKDAGAAYCVDYNEGILRQVKIDLKTGKGETRVIVADLISPTVMELVHSRSDGRPMLGIICSGKLHDSTSSVEGRGSISVTETVTIITEEVDETIS
ncbi:hypothetical protein DL766_001061 [Monosporascus sp. MC13-8B]|uniref:SMP-30/Gluconolactonase/LRE-like region domain-containing protein n=1 Tax=Monosporascus cannonballus TaxID=155416 RepID=A0ABY0H4V9_9PEZI|nr:hypothetical protein DL762_005427 [Monosporascus cannonballus]RYO98639.1 hypothetical protein DL763_002068 [Monosporascus cannonballus]RYP38266.1 hypothetical protein DL766_001061 [Monosporascus sp. MC13-8B]